MSECVYCLCVGDFYVYKIKIGDYSNESRNILIKWFKTNYKLTGKIEIVSWVNSKESCKDHYIWDLNLQFDFFDLKD